MKKNSPGHGLTKVEKHWPRGHLCLQPTVHIWYISTHNNRLNTFTDYKILSTRKLGTQTDNSKLRLEAFVEADFNENFSGRQPHQDVKFFRRSTKSPAQPEDEEGFSSETSENLHILTRMSAPPHKKNSLNSNLHCSNIIFPCLWWWLLFISSTYTRGNLHFYKSGTSTGLHRDWKEKPWTIRRALPSIPHVPVFRTCLHVQQKWK